MPPSSPSPPPATPDAFPGQWHPYALRGIDLFNRHEYFEAHEALETAWMAEPGPIRDLYRGILQVAVAYYHAARGNWIGARKMIARSRRWLEPFVPASAGIDVARLLEDVTRVDLEIARRAAVSAPPLDPSSFQPLHLSR